MDVGLRPMATTRAGRLWVTSVCLLALCRPWNYRTLFYACFTHKTMKCLNTFPHHSALGYSWEDGKIWRSTPQRVKALTGQRATDLACGGDHTLALTEGGVVWGWGRGQSGQLQGGDRGPFVLAPSPLPLLSSTPERTTVRVRAEADCSCADFVRHRDGAAEEVCIGKCTAAVLSAMRQGVPRSNRKAQ